MYSGKTWINVVLAMVSLHHLLNTFRTRQKLKRKLTMTTKITMKRRTMMMKIMMRRRKRKKRALEKKLTRRNVKQRRKGRLGN